VAEAAPALVAAVRDLADRTGARMSEDLDPDGHVRLTLHHPEDLGGLLATTVVRAGGSIVRLEVSPPTLEDAILAMSRARPVGVST
jgi:ABC-2 type transport system ATP-binding protein